MPGVINGDFKIMIHLTTGFVLPCLFILTCLLTTLGAMWKSKKPVQIQPRRKTFKSKVTITICQLSFLFIICNSAQIVGFVLFLVGGGDSLPLLTQGQTYCFSYIVSTLLTFLNAAINPMIFCKNKELRGFALGLVCKGNKVRPGYIMVARLCSVSNQLVRRSTLSILSVRRGTMEVKVKSKLSVLSQFESGV